LQLVLCSLGFLSNLTSDPKTPEQMSHYHVFLQSRVQILSLYIPVYPFSISIQYIIPPESLLNPSTTTPTTQSPLYTTQNPDLIGGSTITQLPIPISSSSAVNQFVTRPLVRDSKTRALYLGIISYRNVLSFNFHLEEQDSQKQETSRPSDSYTQHHQQFSPNHNFAQCKT
jgi:hypothetical protein